MSRRQRRVLEIRGLKKTYGLKPVLRGIDLTVQQGERVALLGANGTGKTTLLRVLAGLTQPSAGSVRVAGLDVKDHMQQIRHLVGFVAHQPYVYGELSAQENLLFFSSMYGVKRAKERACELLRCVGLERRADERVNTFSRGQLQRLAWARALLHAPQLLLLDEADTGLDQEGHELIDRLLKRHMEVGGTTLFTTHQLERAMQTSEGIALLSNGRIVLSERTAALTLDVLQQHYEVLR